MLNSYQAIYDTLQNISRTGSSREIREKSTGLAKKMTKFTTFFGLHFTVNIFSVSEQLSTKMQAKGIPASSTALEVLRAGRARGTYLICRMRVYRARVSRNAVEHQSAGDEAEGILAQTVMAGVQCLKDNLQHQRNDYDVFFGQISDKAAVLSMVEEPTLPRPHKVPRRFLA